MKANNCHAGSTDEPASSQPPAISRRALLGKSILTGSALLGANMINAFHTTTVHASSITATDKQTKQSTYLPGYWAFNGNGSVGTMTIYSVDTQGNLSLSVSFNGLSRIDHWTGTWNESAGQITLIRNLPNNVVQNHIGYLGSNDPQHIILAGYFTESDISWRNPRNRFGWFAQWQSNIIW